MLVLTRDKNETIIIDLSQVTPEQLAELKANGDAAILITNIETRGDKMRLGISAPRCIPVHRYEVYEAIKRHQQAGG